MRIESERVFALASFLPFTKSLSQNAFLRAVRHSFFAILPFLLAVSFLDVLINLILNPAGFVMAETGLNVGNFLTGASGSDYLSHPFVVIMTELNRMVGLGYGLLSMIFTMSLSRRLAEILDADTLMTSLCALCAFLFLIPAASGNGEFVEYVAGRRFLPAFLVAVIASYIYAYISKLKICLYEPLPHLPENLSKFYTAALPVTLTIIALAFLSIVAGEIAELFLTFLAKAIPDSFWQNPLTAFSYQGIIGLLWWLGFPGYGFVTNIEEIAYIPAQLSNQSGETAYIFTSGFFESTALHILGLIIAIFVFSKHGNWRKVALVALPCAVFNIQDPIMFCLPVILNPVFFIPYIIAPIANAALGYIAILWGIVPVFTEVVPWTMPMIFSGSLGAGSYMGGALQVAWLVMDIFIYAPFVITANMLEFGEDEQ